MKTHIKTLFVVVAALGMMGSGCGKKKASDNSDKAGGMTTAPSVKAYTGPVSEKLLASTFMKAATAWGKSGPGRFAPWGNAYKVLLERIGKETGREGNVYFWAYTDGKKCWWIEAENKANWFQNAKRTSASKSMKDAYGRCIKHAKKQ